jgi:hypothetical protein
MRLTQLNADGTWSPGNALYVTNTMTQAVFTPNVTTGDDLEQKNAQGDLCGTYKHPDMIKRYDVTLGLCAPDEELEQMLAGGTLLTDTSVALTAPTAPTGTAQTTGGTLAAGSYKYAVSALGRYGETIATPIASAVTVTGSTGSVGLTWAAVTGAVGYKVYGRSSTGALYLLATITSGLTYTDTGLAYTGGPAPSVNTTAGPGTVGYAAPNLRVGGNPNGVSMEIWTLASVNGNPATTGGGPYRRWVWPWTRNFRQDARTIDSSIMANQFLGEAYENTQWGTGPKADWPLLSTQVFQRARESRFPNPSVGIQVV